MVQNNPPKNLLIRVFSNPFVGLIGWLATILSLILTIYFYFESKESRQLIYYINPVKAVLLRAGQASRLTASYDNRTIQTDITAAQIALWNQGKVAIKKEHLLKPVVIQTENGTPILEATIRKTSRDVAGISLNTQELQQGRVTVSWNILERNDGTVIQLISAGGPELKMQIDGIIEGQNQIEQLKYSGRKIQSAEEQIYGRERERQDSLGLSQ